ncbi:MAG: aromatic-ring-hydroxylating dioxygenase subunit beta [Acidiferrobacteraceae bacterium]|nr:aromatic-ring-hydroxylating dioxygenase subunit beta [Acidiferrobacteraceae bacterium]|tara:strand:+ start:2092 stop:2628 length:537 start_codon:yes stop_codon:yes gene_type:complete
MNSSTEILAASDQNKLARVSIETQVEVERFLFKQAEILDEKEWESWLDLFTEEGFYWMPAEEEQTEGDGEPNIFWEDRNLMLMRISRNTHPRAHSQAPHNRLCHVVSNVLIESENANGDIIVRSRFHCAEYFRYEVRNFSGKYRHLLKKVPEGYRIALQRVDLVNREGPFDYVLQWWV